VRGNLTADREGRLGSRAEEKKETFRETFQNFSWFGMRGHRRATTRRPSLLEFGSSHGYGHLFVWAVATL
jgi:hypothetical protein